MSEIKSMVQLVDPNEQKKLEEELQRKRENESKEYLICYILEHQSETVKEWELIRGRDETISFIRGILEFYEEGAFVDIENSFILVNAENITLEDKISLKEFIDHVNEELDEPICYE